MIDLRYHIVSIVAVFLALGLGIMLGSSVVSDAVDARLSEDATRARQDRDRAEAAAEDLDNELDALHGLVTEQLVPWSLDGRLSGSQVVFINDGAERGALREHVQDALVAAGAQPVGSITLREKWTLSGDEDADSLAKAVEASGLAFDPGDEPGVVAMKLLGEHLLDPTGRQLIDGLTEEGFVSVDRDDSGAWPPTSSIAVVLSPSRRAESPFIPNVIDLATSLGEVTPTLVVSDRPEGQSLVSALRQNGDRPATLSTFDAALDETDPGGVGVVAALLSATDGQGGDWGEEGERFIPPNAKQG